ncbi:MAG TPA: hypothetical protein VFR02_09945 [bacterium]|nr:hypothetical protein [bacterium]
MVRIAKGIAWLGLVLSVGIFTGCGAPRVYPPAFSLYGYQRIVVVPFDDQTQDPALGITLQSEMEDQVLSLNAVPLVDAKQTAAYLKGLKADPASVATDPELMKKIAQKFKADLLLVGAATGYVEILKDEAPQQDSSGHWGFNTFRKVSVAGKAQLLDPASGSLVWSGKNQGYSYTNTFNPLPIPAGVRLPAGLDGVLGMANLVKNRVLGKDDREPATLDENDPNVLLYPNSHYFAHLREEATYELVNAMVDDFRGHNGWTPGMAASR